LSFRELSSFAKQETKRNQEIAELEIKKMTKELIVSLTWAQTLDGSLVKHDRSNISCRESFQMTHGLRWLHDGIMVGVDTLLTDNPQLTTRLPEGTETKIFSTMPQPLFKDFTNRDLQHYTEHHPTPVILDSCLRSPLHARVFNKVRNRSDPIICVSHELRAYIDGDGCVIKHRLDALHGSPQKAQEKLLQLLETGVNVAFVQTDDNGLLDLVEVCNRLSRDYKLCSLMVEGGPRVLSSFLDKGFFDHVIITMSPCFEPQTTTIRLELARPISLSACNTSYRQFGADNVLFLCHQLRQPT
jgi:riboflavin biosynthesis pyrimidine reductase